MMTFCKIAQRNTYQLGPFLSSQRYIFTEVKHEELNIPTIKCRNRPFLPGSESPNFPEFLSKKNNPQFHAIKVNGRSKSMHEISKQLRPYLDEVLKQCFGILIKGLPITNANDFNLFTEAIGYKQMNNTGSNAFRDKVAGNIYSASNHSELFTIEPHNEASYLAKSPGKVMLYCMREGDSGGESPIAFNHDIMADLDATIAGKIIDRKIKYSRNVSHKQNSKDLSWQATFEVKTEEAAERKMKQKNFNWKWKNNGDLIVWSIADATRQHPVRGDDIWFNQIHNHHSSYYMAHPKYAQNPLMAPDQYEHDCMYADGEKFEPEVLDHIRSITWNNAMALKLEKGDIFLHDNYLCQHSRMGYTGDRKFLINLMD